MIMLIIIVIVIIMTMFDRCGGEEATTLFLCYNNNKYNTEYINNINNS
jgi:hypothetical protein